MMQFRRPPSSSISRFQVQNCQKTLWLGGTTRQAQKHKRARQGKINSAPSLQNMLGVEPG